MNLFPELPSYALDQYFWTHAKRPSKIMLGPDVREAWKRLVIEEEVVSGNPHPLFLNPHFELVQFRGIPVGYMQLPGVAVVK